MTLPILQVPNPTLNQICSAVENVDRELVKDMTHYLSKDNCIGLAAIQLGVLVRVIGFKTNEEIAFLINPEVLKQSEQVFPSIERCLSIDYAGTSYTVKRHKIVKVSGFDLHWNRVTIKSRGLLGCVLQHEIDHLGGITINNIGERYYD